MKKRDKWLLRQFLGDSAYIEFRKFKKLSKQLPSWEEITSQRSKGNALRHYAHERRIKVVNF